MLGREGVAVFDVLPILRICFDALDVNIAGSNAPKISP